MSREDCCWPQHTHESCRMARALPLEVWGKIWVIMLLEGHLRWLLFSAYGRNTYFDVILRGVLYCLWCYEHSPIFQVFHFYCSDIISLILLTYYRLVSMTMASSKPLEWICSQMQAMFLMRPQWDSWQDLSRMPIMSLTCSSGRSLFGLIQLPTPGVVPQVNSSVLVSLKGYCCNWRIL